MNPIECLRTRVQDAFAAAVLDLDCPVDPEGFWQLVIRHEQYWVVVEWGTKFGKFAMSQVLPSDDPSDGFGSSAGDPVGDVVVPDNDVDGAFSALKEWFSVPGPWTREECEKQLRQAVGLSEKFGTQHS